jgi:predicted PurR-regulated permease PerM
MTALVERRGERTGRIVLGVLTVLALYLLALVVRPFASALFVAAVLAAALSPWYEGMVRALRGRRQTSAVVMTIALILVVVLPLALLGGVVAREVANGVTYVRDTFRSEGVAGLLNDLPGPLRALAEKIIARFPQQDLQEVAGAQSGRAASYVGGILSATWDMTMQLVMMLIAFFFLLIDGPRLVDWLEHVMPLKRGQTRLLLGDFRNVSVTVLVSSVATAAVQALVALVGYLIAGLPQALFFAFVTFVVGLVPAVGGGAVGLFAALIMLLQGKVGWSVFLALWAILPVGLSDNVVKPLLIRGKVELHGAVVFFALLGGLAVFGPIGLLAGPLVVSFFLAVVRMWGREDNEPGEAPMPGDPKPTPS